MKKEQFIKNLRYSLRKLKKDEREKYLAYYEEIISDMIENGVSEEEAVAHQGETKKSQKKFCGKMQLKESSKLPKSIQRSPMRRSVLQEDRTVRQVYFLRERLHFGYVPIF